jgi:GH15 family glucan-1,4-alpha-glucosidase
MNAIEEKLHVGGGIARFEDDSYMRTTNDVTGNPWFICTLWLAEYHIARAQNLDDLKRPLEILEWVGSAALPSGILGEQFDPESGFHLSVSPLTWSHSTFVSTVLNYQKKAESLTKQ